MSTKAVAVALSVLVLGALAVFWFLERELTDAYTGPGAGDEVITALERSQADLRRLAALDPRQAQAYRERFAASQVLLNRLRIVAHNRQALARRFQMLLLGIAALTLSAAGVILALRLGRDAGRLARLQAAVEALASGSTDLDVGVRGRDAIGLVAGTVERVSRAVARDRQRLAALKNLSSWQEAARRVAHELRTPLTSARLAVEQAQRMITEGSPDDVPDVLAGVGRDIQRLGELSSQVAGFAKLGPPQTESVDLLELTQQFAATFAHAWPHLRLEVIPKTEQRVARVDRVMIRHALTNLCDNTARAAGNRAASVRFIVAANARTATIEIADDGPGIPESVRDRVFEPYVTTASIGEGLGLGLAISRKILLDHGGELELVRTGPTGTTFRLVLPVEGP